MQGDKPKWIAQQPRIPEEVGGIQVNHCRTPTCRNFGVAASTLPVDIGRPRADGKATRDRYIIVGGGKGVPALKCRDCGISVILKSNRGIHEELERISAYMKPPATACRNHRCENFGKAVSFFPSLYRRHGTSSYGTQRFQCRTCGRTCSEPKPRAPAEDQLKAYKNATVFRSILGKMPVRRILEAADIGAETFYARLKFFERQCLAFAAHRERRLAEMAIDRLYLSSDQQYFLVNWNDAEDKRAVQLRAIGTADNRSRYAFAMNLNYDPDVRPEIVEVDALLNRDDQRYPPFRRYARLWLERDYAKAAMRRQRRSIADTIVREIAETYQELLERDELDIASEMTDRVRLPRTGMQVHNEYTIFGHFHHLRNLFRRVGKVRWFVDQDSALRGGLLSAFKREIKTGACDVFFVKVDRLKTEEQRREAVAQGKRRLAAAKKKPENQGKSDRQLRRELIKEAWERMASIGPWGDLWMQHPIPTKDEPDKWICHLTNQGLFDGEEDHLAAIYDMATLRGVEQFFMQIRRRFSLLERMLNRAGSTERIWNIYSPYNPVVVQRLLNIYRVFYNYAKPGEDKKTPAMRLGLAAGPVDVRRIINFHPER
jgi:transposase-like protein